MTCTCFFCKMQQIDVLTEELIIAKADIDFDTNPDKREHVERLSKMVEELMR